MTLTVLSVAYPFAPVGPDAVGGAEQILAQLDAALVVAGHRSIVIACEGSRPCGELMTLPRIAAPLDEAAKARGQHKTGQTIRAVLQTRQVDLVHLHGVDFAAYLPPAGVPAVATLHLPLAWYEAAVLRPVRPDTHLVCVSQAQRRTRPDLAGLTVIENGVPVEAFTPARRHGRHAVMLARICPEKGVHIAIEAAKHAGVPLVIAGEVFPYRAHRRYFEDEVRPRLDRLRRFIGPVGFGRKRRLLATARCLLIPSLVPETSSLVAREALAAGTPVVGFDTGALRDAIEHDRTGFLVRDEAAIADAIRRCDTLDRAECRRTAEERFPIARMVEQYVALYQALARPASVRGAVA